jgi:hypothetical protein
MYSCVCVNISATRFTALLFVAPATCIAKGVTYFCVCVNISATRFTVLFFAPRQLLLRGICLSSSGSTLFAPFRGRGVLRLCLLSSLRLRTRSYTDANLFEPLCQTRGDELDGAGTHELVHHIRVAATPDEQGLARRKPKQLPIWDLWLSSKWKQLDAHLKHNISGIRCPAPPDITVLRSQLRFAQTELSRIDQPYIRLLFVLSAAMSFDVTGVDCTNAYANAPSPDQPTYVRIDDAYADWHRPRHGKEVDRSWVLPVLKALQAHPGPGALWENTSTRSYLPR